MKRKLAILLGATAVLGLAACQSQSETKQEDTVSTGAAEDEVATPELSEELANARAFQTAWEAPPPVSASDPRLNDRDDVRWPEPVRGRFEFRSGRVIQLSSDLYALISSGYVEGAAASAPGAIAFHYLARTADGFRLLDVSPLFVAGGVGGQPPTFSVRQGIMPAPVVIVETQTPNARGTCAVAQLVELTPGQPVLRATALPMAFAPASGGGAWIGELATGRPGRDFDVQYSGASDGQAVWILTDVGTYRASGQPRLSGC